jgi:sigma-E factor negative regulatory protein RseA
VLLAFGNSAKAGTAVNLRWRIRFDMAGNAMDTQKRLHENISALADGELPDSERELAFAALDSADGRAAWRAYHLIGDVLRGTPGGELSNGFSASLAARLAAESAYTPALASSDDGNSPTDPAAADPAAQPWGQAVSSADVMLP